MQLQLKLVELLEVHSARTTGDIFVYVYRKAKVCRDLGLRGFRLIFLAV